MTHPSVFRSWYRSKLGRFPWLVQAVLWVFYGFVWIPVWYLATASDGTFAGWYRVKIGHQLPVAQVAMWVLYGFIWIPAWYFVTRSSTTLAPTVAGSHGVASESSQDPSVPPAAAVFRPEPVWPLITNTDRVLALLLVRPVAVEVAANAGEVSTNTKAVRVLRWNYTRLFALAWASGALIVAGWNAPRPAGPTSVDLFFMMVGLLYFVFAFVQFFNGSYWRSFVIMREYPRLPNRFELLAECAAGGLVQVIAAAALVGAAIGIGVAMRR